MPHILITGAYGQVGQEFQYLAHQYPDFQFTFKGSKDLDITSEKAVFKIFENQFDYCINCAAYTAVDKAESNSELAKLVNETGAKNLASACLNHQVKLIHLSTDYVYHNHQNTPFKETDETNPQGVYAATKLAGDLIIQQILPQATIIRTSWVYSSFGYNFVKTMLRLGKERESLNVVFDQIGTPTYACDLAKAILTIINKVENGSVKENMLFGIYHYSNEGVTSWYDFAKAIFRIENISCKVTPIETKEYSTPAKRPPFSLLNKAKIKSAFDLEIPHWEESLSICLKEINKTTNKSKYQICSKTTDFPKQYPILNVNK